MARYDRQGWHSCDWHIHFLMPVVIKLFKAIDLLDIPDRRKIHKTNAPSLGGLAFFIGFILALFTALDGSEFTDLKYFIASIIMIFLLGVRDDIASLEAPPKIFQCKY